MTYRFELRRLEMPVPGRSNATHYVWDNKRKGTVKIGDYAECSRWIQEELEAIRYF